MAIKTYKSFGYEGEIVEAEAKEGSLDLAESLAYYAKEHEDEMPRSQDAFVMVYGTNEEGKVVPIRGTYAALESAIKEGIKYAIIPEGTETVPDGIIVQKIKTLEEAFHTLCNVDEFDDCPLDMVNPAEAHSNGFYHPNDREVTFSPVSKNEGDITELKDRGLVYAAVIAVTGRHSILAFGSPGTDKTSVLSKLPQIMPNLDHAEQLSVNRIYSLAGLSKANQKIFKRPFRMPHPTASIEGICGGGPDCRPGEISLAHNGVLFLDEAAEFRSSVLQMLKVPLESKNITLTRAGKSTTYPANFQLAMSTLPCPCGNYGAHDKICLCSAKAVEQYWKKFSAPLLDRIVIRYNCDNPVLPFTYFSGLSEVYARMSCAVEKQFKRQGKYNQDLTSEEVKKYCRITSNAQGTLDAAVARYGYSPREVENILKLARTVLDFKDNVEWDEIGQPSMTVALNLHAALPVKGE